MSGNPGDLVEHGQSRPGRMAWASSQLPAVQSGMDELHRMMKRDTLRTNKSAARRVAALAGNRNTVERITTRLRPRLAFYALMTAGLLLGALTPSAGADPVGTAAEQNFYSQVYLYAHPSLTDARLLELGHQACAVRRSGMSTGDAKLSLWKTLEGQGMLSSRAEIGSLVHVAVDTLRRGRLPATPNPDGGHCYARDDLTTRQHRHGGANQLDR